MPFDLLGSIRETELHDCELCGNFDLGDSDHSHPSG